MSRVCVDNNSWLEITYTHDHTSKTVSHNPCVNNNEILSMKEDNSTQTGRWWGRVYLCIMYLHNTGLLAVESGQVKAFWHYCYWPILKDNTINPINKQTKCKCNFALRTSSFILYVSIIFRHFDWKWPRVESAFTSQKQWSHQPLKTNWTCKEMLLTPTRKTTSSTNMLPWLLTWVLLISGAGDLCTGGCNGIR